MHVELGKFKVLKSVYIYMKYIIFQLRKRGKTKSKTCTVVIYKKKKS